MGRAVALKPSRHKGGHPPLSRAELPVDTVSLARYLIGKILVREMAEGAASGAGADVGGEIVLIYSSFSEFYSFMFSFLSSWIL